MSAARLELQPSWKLAAAISAAHVVAALSVAVVLPSWSGYLLAAALVALGGAAAWSRALLRSSTSVRALEIAGEALTIELASGERFEAKLAEHRHVSRLMVTLSVVRPLRRTILVTRDMLSGDLFRRLRIWALWRRLPGVAEKQLAA